MRILLLPFLFLSFSCFAQSTATSKDQDLDFEAKVFSKNNEILVAESPKFKLLKTDLTLEGVSRQKSLLFKGKHFSALSDTRILDFGEISETKITDTKTPLKLASQTAEAKDTKFENEIVEKSKGINYALFIANSDYEFNTSGLGDLNKPILDAQKLKTVLNEKYQFENEHILFLQNAGRTETLNRIESIAKKITEKDNLLIFYAGHGYWDEFLQLGYWIPADARFENKSTWISNSTIKDYIGAIRSKHTLLITDACFSGSIMKTRSVISMNNYAVSKLYKLPSRKAMTSGTLTKVPDESVFLKYLLKRLKENESDFISSSQLFFSMQNAILNNSNTVPQYGTIQNTGDEGGDFIFMKRK